MVSPCLWARVSERVRLVCFHREPTQVQMFTEGSSAESSKNVLKVISCPTCKYANFLWSTPRSLMTHSQGPVLFAEWPDFVQVTLDFNIVPACSSRDLSILRMHFPESLTWSKIATEIPSLKFISSSKVATVREAFATSRSLSRLWYSKSRTLLGLRRRFL